MQNCLSKLLSSEELLERVTTTMLANRIETTVQRAVATALEAVLGEVSTLEKEVASLQKTVSALYHCIMSHTDDLEPKQPHRDSLAYLRQVGSQHVQGEVEPLGVCELPGPVTV